VSTLLSPRIKPLTRNGSGWTALEAVRIESYHPDFGPGMVVLDPLQTEHVHARLSQISFAFLHHIDTGSLVTTLNTCGAEVLPVTRIEGDEVSLLAVMVRNSSGRAYLLPEQVREATHHLEAIILEFLHHNGWGGEDARNQ